MYTSLIISYGVILTVAFILKKKKMHMLEIILVWMSSIFIYNNIAFLSILNYSLIKIPDHNHGFLAYEIFRLLIVPLSIVWLFDVNSSLASIGRKVINMLGFILYMCSLDYILDEFKIVTHTNSWAMTYSIGLYSGLAFCVYVTYFFFHKLFKQEVLKK